MILSLSIKNYALIEDIHVPLTKGLTIILEKLVLVNQYFWEPYLYYLVKEQTLAVLKMPLKMHNRGRIFLKRVRATNPF